MNKTKIPWCDYTWNPITGCSPASRGCAHCYAAAIARRFKKPWGTPVVHPERIQQPWRQHTPGRVFVCSVSDLGHPGVKVEWRAAIAQAMRDAPWHTYILLTKRPGPWLMQFPAAAWCGVSAEDQIAFNQRWPALPKHATGAAVLFVSVEPMLGPVDIDSYRPPDLVIAGPETGPGARPCLPAWIDDLEAECVTSGIPFFDKRDGAGRRREFPKEATR